MAGVVKNLMVRAGADFSAITKQSKKAAGSMKGMQTSVCRSCNLMSSAATGLKRAFSALGVGLSIASLISFSKAAVEAYDTQVEGEMRLARVMRNTMSASNAGIQSILDLTDAQQKLGIVGDEVQLAGAQELATYLEYADSLRTLIPVMNDMAAQQYGYKVTAEQTTTIATMLGKVMSGQVSGLSRYGYYFTQAQEAVLKYGTEAERAAMLAEVVEQSVGGMNAALAATPTGRMKQLSDTLGDIKENFGRAVRTISTTFLPILNAVASVLAAVATVANKVAQTIANVFGGQVAGKEWQYVPAGTAAAAEDAAEGMDDLAKSTEKAGKAAKNNLQQASFDTLHILADNSKNASSTVSEAASGGSSSSGASAGLIEMNTGVEAAGEGIGWLQKLLEKAKTKWEEFKKGLHLENLINAWHTLKTSLVELWQTIKEKLGPIYENVLKPFAQWTINELAPALVESLAAAFELLGAVIDILSPILSALWTLLSPIIKLLGEKAIMDIQNLTSALRFVAAILRGDFSEALNIVKETGDRNLKYLKDKLQAVQELALRTADAIKRGWQNLPEWWEKGVVRPIEVAGTWVWEKITAAAAAAWDSLPPKWQNAALWFKGNVWDPLWSWGSDTWMKLQDACKQANKTIVETFSEAKSNLTQNLAAIQQVGQAAWTRIRQFGVDAWSGIRGTWAQAPRFFDEAIVTPIKNGIRSMVNGLLSMFEGMANGAISGVNAITSALNKLQFSIPDWIPIIGGKSFGLNLPTFSPVELPRLATGAVIPPNREFAAILGDQTQGMNIETPEHLLREIIREETGNGVLLDLLGDILRAIRSDRDVLLDDQRVGKVVKRILGQQARAAGYSRI